MGKPRLLVEAASSYRGDLEDRLTEVFAAALDANEAFCRRFVREAGVTGTSSSFDVRTQESFDGHSRLIDLVVRCFDAGGVPRAIVFVEHKYNPNRLAEPYWFSDDQAERQRVVLARQPFDEKCLLGIASVRDLPRGAPGDYGRLRSWQTVAELAHAAGGDDDWQTAARLPTAPASQRILLEFLTYLKGDAVGALEDEDLVVLGRMVLAEERVERLLQRTAEQLDVKWEDQVEDDWETPSGIQIYYVLLDAPQDSWLAQRSGGYWYIFVAGAEWTDDRAVGQPTVYAGGGWGAKRDEREALAVSAWPAKAKAAGFDVLADTAGNYVTKSRPLSELVTIGNTLSGQVDELARWAADVIDDLIALPAPPDVDRGGSNLPRSARRRARA